MAQWFYAVNGQQQGPVSDEDIKTMLAQGRLSGSDLVWSEGMANWQRADSVFPPAAGTAAPPSAARRASSISIAISDAS